MARFLESSVKAKEIKKTVFETTVDMQLFLHVAFLLSSFAKRQELKIQSSQQCSSFSSHGVIILVSCQLLPCLKVAYINLRSSHLNDHLILSKRLTGERSLHAGIVHNIFYLLLIFIEELVVIIPLLSLWQRWAGSKSLFTSWHIWQAAATLTIMWWCQQKENTILWTPTLCKTPNSHDCKRTVKWTVHNSHHH